MHPLVSAIAQSGAELHYRDESVLSGGDGTESD
jgi:hypothetical protein